MSSDTDHAYGIVDRHDVADTYADSNVPGEFRQLIDALDCGQLAVTFVRIPRTLTSSRAPATTTRRSRRIYLLTRGALTMHFLDTRDDRAAAAVRVAPGTIRSPF